jgi:hypothetical protein
VSADTRHLKENIYVANHMMFIGSKLASQTNINNEKKLRRLGAERGILPERLFLAERLGNQSSKLRTERVATHHYEYRT